MKIMAETKQTELKTQLELTVEKLKKNGWLVRVEDRPYGHIRITSTKPPSKGK